MSAYLKQISALLILLQVTKHAFDALILNEDRHTNNILFLYDPK
ncbi:hypothetical protein MKZ08_07945 [Viridibacillus sp. FSL R5-0477]|nr:hypothetical protein [Viridibacillus arenosi]